MRVLVRGLEPSRDRSDFYELWLTANGKPIASCGRFVVADGLTTVTLSVPYGLRRYDGWVVTRAGSDAILLTTLSCAYGAVRSFATNAACVIGISRSRNVSAAAAYCWISYCALVWLRRPQKCISERGLQLQ